MGPAEFGILLAAIGVGAAIGPLVLRRWIRPAARAWLFGPYALRGVVDLTLATVASPTAAGAALLLYGTASDGHHRIQHDAADPRPAEARGRVLTLYDLLWNGARLISLGLGGLIAEAFGIRTVYAASGVLLLVAATYGAARPDQTSAFCDEGTP